MKKILQRSFVKWIVLALFAAGYLVYLFFMFAKMPIDSDWASLNLEANDILAGNIFLKEWNFTGATFLFTEIPLYLPGALAFGISVRGVLVGIALGGWLLFFAGFSLLREGLPKETFWESFFLYAALIAIPTEAVLKNLRAHSGVYVLMMVLILLVRRIRAEECRFPWRLAVVYGVLLALAAASDLFLLTLFVFPLMLVIGWELIADQTERETKRNLWILTVTVGAVIVGKMIEKVYLSIGGTPLNSRVGRASWVGESIVLEYARNYLFGTMKLFGASAGETPVFSIQSVALLIKFALYVIGLLIIANQLKRFFRREGKTDFINILLIFSILLHGAWVVVGGFLINTENALRYIAYSQIALAVLLVRTAFMSKMYFKLPLVRNKFPVRVAVLICGAALIVSTFQLPSSRREPTAQDRLATFLYDSGYTSGYGDFWIASHVVVSSENRVAIRAVRGDFGSSGEIFRYLWFNRTDWYDDPEANFFVVRLKDPLMNVTEKSILHRFGEPIREIKFEDYLILEYPKGLNERIDG